MKRVFAIIAVCVAGKLSAQQLQQVSQFMLNTYAVNTAFAGQDTIIEARILNRSQWSGITDAPRTLNLSVNGMTRNPDIGIGGLLFSDNAGPTRRSGVKLSYAHHFKLTQNWHLGLSAGLGVLQFSIDGTRIELDEDDDPALFSQKRSQVVFDASFSALAYRDDFYIGVTLPQLLQNDLDLFDSVEQEENKLEDHYYVIAGYSYDINSDFTVQPAILAKYVSPAPLKVDVSARVIYQDKVWLGGTFRSKDAVSLFVGYEHNRQISIGYAYDMTTTAIQSFTGSTHELTLAFKIVK